MSSSAYSYSALTPLNAIKIAVNECRNFMRSADKISKTNWMELDVKSQWGYRERHSMETNSQSLDISTNVYMYV